MSVISTKAPAGSNPSGTITADYKIGGDASSGAAPKGSAYQLVQHKTPSKGKSRSNPMFRAPPEPTARELDDARLLVQQGNEYMKVNDYEKAFDYYGKAVSLNPRDAGAKLKLADAAIKLERVGLAHNLLTERLNLNPEDKESRKKRLKLNQDWSKAMVPVVERYQQKKSENDEEKQGAKEFLKVEPQLRLEAMVDSAVLQALDFEEAKKALDTEFGGKMDQLHKLPPEQKKQLIAAIDMKMTMAMSAAQLPLGDPDFAEQVIRNLKEIVAHGYKLLHQFASGDSDAQIQAFAPLYLAKQQALNENFADAMNTYKAIADQGYAKLGGGDAAAGKSKLEDILSQVQSLQKEAEALQKNKSLSPQKLKTELEAKQKTLEGLVVEVPPGLVDAHQFMLQVEVARQVQKEGLKKLGNGDVETGRKVAQEKIAEGKKLNDEMVALSREIRAAAAKGKYSQISKLMKDREEKALAAGELAKSLPSPQFVQSFIMLEQIEVSEQRETARKAAIQRAREMAVKAGTNATVGFLLDARNSRRHEALKDAWFVGFWTTVGRCPVWGDGKTRFDDNSTLYLNELSVLGAATHKVAEKKAASLKEALNQLETGGSGQEKSLAPTLHGSSLEGLNVDDLLEYSAGYGSDVAKGKKLLDSARSLVKADRTKNAGRSLLEVLAQSPDAGLAADATAELKKL